jgi:hypothetical protein
MTGGLNEGCLELAALAEPLGDRGRKWKDGAGADDMDLTPRRCFLRQQQRGEGDHDGRSPH